MKGLFIAGTDTGVGKTFFTCALAQALMGDGIDVGIFKPVQSGSPREDPEGDACLLRDQTGITDPLDLICPAAFKAPLAPLAASGLEGITLPPDWYLPGLIELSSRHSMVLTEGAGGLMVPITDKLLMIDIIQRINMPVILVARPYLGTINHTLLSLEALKNRRIRTLGVVVNGITVTSQELESLEFIEEFSGIPLLGTLPRLEKGIKSKDLGLWLKQYINIADILGSCREG
jgi:dethiobiotin synthetase